MVIVVLARWNLTRLMAEMMVNTMVWALELVEVSKISVTHLHPYHHYDREQNRCHLNC